MMIFAGQENLLIIFRSKEMNQITKPDKIAKIMKKKVGFFWQVLFLKVL